MGKAVQFNMIVSGILLHKTPDTIFNVMFYTIYKYTIADIEV